MGIFRFKNFLIDDTGCGMKTGTDSVLIGAWCPLPTEGKVLDVGCGSGVISMMIAQRNPSLEITAVEIDPAAAGCATVNIQNLPFRHRITVVTGDICGFAQHATDRYDLIVSNPPYFRQSLKGKMANRNLARHDIGLSLAQLASTASQLLRPGGCFALILPCDTVAAFESEAQKHDFMINRQLVVSHKKGMPPIRSLLTCIKSAPLTTPTVIGYLAIRQTDDSYSDDYLLLVRDFYLFA